MVALNLVKNGEADAIVSAGSTGALLTGALLIVGRLPGVERPALGTCLPTKQALPFCWTAAQMWIASPNIWSSLQRWALSMWKMFSVSKIRRWHW